MTTRNEWIDRASRLLYARLFGDWDAASVDDRERVCDASTELYDVIIMPRLHEAWQEGNEATTFDLLRPVHDDSTRTVSQSPYAVS